MAFLVFLGLFWAAWPGLKLPRLSSSGQQGWEGECLDFSKDQFCLLLFSRSVVSDSL